MLDVFVAVVGLALGSFLNVCISRLPKHESIVRPRSHCPKCGQAIRWYENIPVASYIALGGRCAHCRERISPVYPVVEVATAALLVVAFDERGPTLEFLKAAAFIMLLLVLIFTDLNERTIPHSVTLVGIALGLGFSFVAPVDDRLLGWILGRAGLALPGPIESFLGALAGALVGGGLFYGVGEAFYWLRGIEALGFGDVMLMLMVGTFLGAPLALLTILLGSVGGVLIAAALYTASPRYRGSYHWPYGTFLGAAAIGSALGGPALLGAYLRWSGLAA